jgi:hypothetical protein
VKKPRKPSAKAGRKSAPKSLLDIPKRRLRKLAKAAERKLVKAARPPTPEQLAQRVELLYALMEGQEVVRVPRLSERNAPQKRHRPKSEPAIEPAANPLLRPLEWLSVEIVQLKEAGKIPTGAGAKTKLAKLLEQRMVVAVQARKCSEAIPWSSIRARLYEEKLSALLK